MINHWMNHKRNNMDTDKSMSFFICLNRLGMGKKMYCSQSLIPVTLFNATINKACLGKFRGLNSQLGNPECYASGHLNRPPDVTRLNLLMLIALLHRNCRKLLNGEIFVAQVYFVMFNARRAACRIHAPFSSWSASCNFTIYSFRASSFSYCCHGIFTGYYIAAQNPQLLQNFM